MNPNLKLCAAALIISLNMTASAAVHYVSQASAAPAPPYATWDTAATNIQDAIDAATAGDEIVVTNGVYATGGRAVYGTMTNRVVIDKAVSVRSVNGPELTFIVGQGVGTGATNLGDGAIRCVYVGTNAVVSGFTLANGHTRTTGDRFKEMSGGGAWCESSGVLTNCTFTSNSAREYGGGIYSGILKNCRVTGNFATFGGGGYDCNLAACILMANDAHDGGGAYLGALTNCTLTGNSARAGAGANSSTLNNCTITGNSAGANAGGVCGGTLKNSIVYYNAAPDNPNYCDVDMSFSCTTPLPPGTGNIMTDPIFIDTNGWANLRLQSNSPCINAGQNAFVTCSADLDGNPRIINGTVDIGAYEFQGFAHYVNVNNANPKSPYSTWETAATNIQDAIDAATAGDEILVTNGVYASGGRAVSGTMTNRVAIDKAVTVRSVNGPDLTIIMGQGAGGLGTNAGEGAIRCVYLGTNAVLNGFTLNNGHTRTNGDTYKEQSGGGIFCEASALVTNCYFNGNSARQYGGGAYNGTLKNCILIGNAAEHYTSGVAGGYGGGAAYSILINSVLTQNSAGRAGGAFHAKINNCTLSGNSAGWGCGGTESSALNNSICYFNSAPHHPNYDGSTFTNCCTTPLPAGSGNIDADPMLASASHLSAQSPCIRRGSSAYASGVDIDGEPWINPPCMGADQFVAEMARGDLSVSIDAGYTNTAVAFSISFTAQISGPLTSSVWSFGDGTLLTNRSYASHSWASPGLYEVRLTAYNDSYPGGISSTVLVQAAILEVYYVNVANSTPAFPYTSWAAASATIQEAVDAGTQIGRLVRVTNGIYSTGGRAIFGAMTNRAALSEGVVLRSENGPLVTIIEGQPAPGTTTDGDGAIRCAYIGPNAFLCGFTLTNGHTRTSGDAYQEQRGGGAWCSGSGVIANCILSGNFAQQYGGGVWCGILNNCLLLGNSANQQGGGANLCKLNNCTLIGNSSVQGGGADSCAIYNCIVYYNKTASGPNCNLSTVDYSCTTLLPSGSGLGNITNAPLFTNTNDWINLRLESNSPCINAGKNAYVTGSTDLDGNPRIAGGRVDMGAYEFQGVGLTGLPGWLWQYGLPTDGSADSIDSDADGLNNYQEWRAGTDPTSAASVLRLTAQPSASTVQLQWQGVSGINYYLQRSTNLSATPPFQPLATNISGTAGPMIYTDDNPPAQVPLFYRLGVSE